MISVRRDRRIGAAVLAWKAADRDLKRITRGDTAREFRPVWTQEIRRRALSDDTISALLRTGVTFSGGNPPEGRAYTATRAIRGGARPFAEGPEFEFGTGNRDRRTRYSMRPAGSDRSVIVTRHASRQMGRRIPIGRTVYPTVRKIAPRVVSYWVSSIVRAYSQTEAVR